MKDCFRPRPFPREESPSGWLDPLPAPPPARILEDEGSADLVIVGAGFTGLAAARRAAELRPGARVVVLDAHRAGESASGRSSGFVVDLAGFTKGLGGTATEASIRISRRGIAELRRVVGESAIECDWDDRGWLHVAAGEAGLRDLLDLKAWLEGRGESFEWLAADGLRRVTGTGYYRAGLRLPGRPLVDAGKLVRGLAASLPAQVTLHEDSPVLELLRDGDSWRVRTPRGSVQAPRVIVAVNGGAPRFGILGRQLFPLITFGSLTRPLTEDEQAALGGERQWGVLAQDPMGSSVRRTRDQRLLIRNSAYYSRSLQVPEPVLERAIVAHRRALVARFPQIAHVPFAHSWSGIMGATPRRSPFFGEIAPGLAAAAGYTGAGLALGTAAGMGLAESLFGAESEIARDFALLPAPARQPPEPFLSWGIRWTVARMNAAAGDIL
jgi:glycine/D-amino acid oxidase-like deaminating enzyme